MTGSAHDTIQSARRPVWLRAPIGLGGSRPGRRGALALGIYTGLAYMTCALGSSAGRPEIWLAMLAVPAAFAARSRPLLFAAALICGGMWLRIVWVGLPPFADQLEVARAAATIALDGGNPYLARYAESVPPGAPFVYGPLGLVGGLIGVWGEVLAGGASMVLLAWKRCWLSLAIYASLVLVVQLTASGANDVAPGFFIAAGMVMLVSRPLAGGILLAIAAALKPYALAWFPGAIGYGGMAALAGTAVGSLVLWAPLLLWGPATMLQAVEDARKVHTSANAINIPELRLLALPIALGSLLLRRWTHAAISGLLIFVIVLFFDRWVSWTYLLAIAPLLGILLEGRRARPASEADAPADMTADRTADARALGHPA